MARYVSVRNSEERKSEDIGPEDMDEQVIKKDAFELDSERGATSKLVSNQKTKLKPLGLNMTFEKGQTLRSKLVSCNINTPHRSLSRDSSVQRLQH